MYSTLALTNLIRKYITTPAIYIYNSIVTSQLIKLNIQTEDNLVHNLFFLLINIIFYSSSFSKETSLKHYNSNYILTPEWLKHNFGFRYIFVLTISGTYYPRLSSLLKKKHMHVKLFT